MRQVLTEYYLQCGTVGAEVARDDMIRHWTAQAAPLPNVQRTPLFTEDTRVDAPAQRTLQRNNHCYDLSYWVQSNGVWVLFHCYPHEIVDVIREMSVCDALALLLRCDPETK
jgi:hypothetical protein